MLQKIKVFQKPTVPKGPEFERLKQHFETFVKPSACRQKNITFIIWPANHEYTAESKSNFRWWFKHLTFKIKSDQFYNNVVEYEKCTRLLPPAKLTTRLTTTTILDDLLTSCMLTTAKIAVVPWNVDVAGTMYMMSGSYSKGKIFIDLTTEGKVHLPKINQIQL